MARPVSSAATGGLSLAWVPEQAVERRPADGEAVVQAEGCPAHGLVSEKETEQPGDLLGGDPVRRAGTDGVVGRSGRLWLASVREHAHRFHHLGADVAGQHPGCQFPGDGAHGLGIFPFDPGSVHPSGLSYPVRDPLTRSYEYVV
jgi:hypothetical protein